MSVPCARRFPALLLAAGLALALACGGSADGDPPPTEAPPTPTATPEPPAAPVEATAPTTPATPTETAPTPRVTLDPQVPAPEPPAPEASTPTDEPASTATAATDEAEALPLLYDTYDLSGAVAEPGHYVFLADPADTGTAVTTYEGLRDGTAAALLIHTHDAHGVSQAAHYDAVATGDLVEWKQADDCFVRYTVTEAPAPAAGATARTFGVDWMTYAFTGCSGTIPSGTPGRLTFGDLPNLGGTSLSAPIIHGDSFQLVPENWTGATEAGRVVEVPEALRNRIFAEAEMPAATTEADAVKFTFWRQATPPPGWSFYKAHVALTAGWLTALYESPTGGIGLEISVGPHTSRRYPDIAAYSPEDDDPRLFVTEARIIAGRPATLSYSPAGPYHDDLAVIRISIYDPATGTKYEVRSSNLTLMGANVEPMIAVATSLFEPPNAP